MRFAVFDVPKNGTEMGLCQLRVQTHSPQQGYQDRFIEFRGVVLPPRPVEAAGQPFKGVWTVKEMEWRVNSLWIFMVSP